MFLRFAVTRVDKDSRKPQRVFVAAHELLDSLDLTAAARAHIREILIWFNQNLPVPGRKFKASRAIFSFKSTAQESIRKIWDLVHRLRSHGFHVDVKKCRHLGNICYEDDLQVAAYPSPQDGRIVVQ
jgi:hypothetical protein